MTDPRDRTPLEDSDLKRFLEKTPMLERLTEQEQVQIERQLMVELRRIKQARDIVPWWKSVDWRAVGIAAVVLLSFAVVYLYPILFKPPARPPDPDAPGHGIMPPARAVGPVFNRSDPSAADSIQAPFPDAPTPATGTLEAPTRTQLNWLPKENLCGPNSLWIAALRLGVQVEQEQVARAVDSEEGGATLWDLKRAAEELGLQAEGVRMTWEELRELEGPAVLFVRGDHFVCVDPRERADPTESIRVHDLPRPAEWVTRGQIEPEWSGEALVLSRAGTGIPPGCPSIRFASLYADFGIEEGPISLSFPFHNSGSEPLEILDIHKSCGCVSAGVTEERIPPGGEALVSVDLDLSGQEGEQKRSIELDTNDPTHPKVELFIHGLARSSVRISTDKVDFGDLAVGERATRGFAVFDRFDGTLNVTGVELSLESAVESPPKLSVHFERVAPEVARERTRKYALGENAIAYWVEVVAEVTAETSQEGFRGQVLVKTDSERRPVIAVPFELNVLGDYYAVPEKVYFGLVRPGQAISKEISIRRRSGARAEIEAARALRPGLEPESAGGIHVDLDTASTTEGAATVRLVMAHRDGAHAPAGFESGILEVRAKDGAILRVPWTSIQSDGQ